MNRAARLQAAGRWLAGFEGKNVLRSYARWFGVDWICAIKELEMLGVRLDEGYVRAEEWEEPEGEPPPDRAMPDDLDVPF